jgi:hypothetical protein
MTGSSAAFSPRVRASIRIGARIVLFTLVVQLLAIDHWHPPMTSVVGVENSQAHVAHCHGNVAGCADSAGFAGTLTDVSLLPMPPQPFVYAEPESMSAPPEASLSAPDQPPQTA